ncbi:MAG: mucoidy inhibitor MuiA family protein [Breznakibacter sp.]
MRAAFLLSGLLIGTAVPAAWGGTLNERSVETVVSEATVYIEGAQLVRKKGIDLPAGETVLKFVGLSPDMDPKSIRVKASGQVTVVSVNHQFNYVSEWKKQTDAADIQQKIDDIDKQLEEIGMKQAILQEELTFLNLNRELNGKEQALTAAALKEAALFYQTKLTVLKTDELAYRRTTTELTLQRNKLVGQLNGLSAQKDEPTAEVVVKVNAKTASRYNFELTYLVKKAGWFPSYDIRANSVAEPIVLTYKANVYQRTGEDWKNVKIAFSSGNPSQGGVAPKLKPYHLDYYLRAPVYLKNDAAFSGKVTDLPGEPLPGASVSVPGSTIGTVTDLNGNFNLVLPPNTSQVQVSFVGYKNKTVPVGNGFTNIAMEENNLALEEVVVTGYGTDGSVPAALQGRVAGISSRKVKMESLPVEMETRLQTTTVLFNIAMPYTVLSDGKYYAVEMDHLTLETAFEYYAVPKIDRDAFLMAHVTNWEQYNLLGGEANIYFEDTYTGKTVIDPGSFKDTLSLSLGRDRNIVVTRDKSKEFTRKQILGSRTSETHHWAISMRNQKQETVTVSLFDQVPVSARDEIEVTDLVLSGGRLDKPSGEVVWKVELKPGESRKIDLSYQVKYPKGRNLMVE